MYHTSPIRIPSTRYCAREIVMIGRGWISCVAGYWTHQQHGIIVPCFKLVGFFDDLYKRLMRTICIIYTWKMREREEGDEPDKTVKGCPLKNFWFFEQKRDKTFVQPSKLDALGKQVTRAGSGQHYLEHHSKASYQPGQTVSQQFSGFQPYCVAYHSPAQPQPCVQYLPASEIFSSTQLCIVPLNNSYVCDITYHKWQM